LDDFFRGLSSFVQNIFKTLFLSAALLGSVSITAWAQTPPVGPETAPTDTDELAPEKDTVATRARPDYDPIGTRLGGFFLYPTIGVGETYNDNIRFTETNKTSDFITTVTPAVDLKSNWNSHALNFNARADLGRYASNSEEDYNDWQIGTDGRLDILRDTALTGGLKYAELHEGRSSPDQTGASEPVTYRQYGPNLQLSQRFNRLRASVGGDLTAYDYDDAKSRSGATLNMDDRDRVDTTGNIRLGYEIVPQYEAFVRGVVNQRNYDARTDDSGFQRDSKGWELVAGLSLDLGSVTFGNIYAGYLRQEFDDARLSTINGASYGGDITWNPTTLTTVKFLASRSVDETTLSGAAGSLATRAQATVDHELLRNLILNGNVEYVNNQYEGISREDDIINVGPGADYLLNRYLRLRLRYTYGMRDSSATGSDYDVNTVFLRLLAQY